MRSGFYIKKIVGTPSPLYKSKINVKSLPSANEVWGKVMFLHLFTGRGVLCPAGSLSAGSLSGRTPPVRQRADGMHPT